MTNEQLRVLLDWIAESLRVEASCIKEQLEGVEGIERKPNFYKDGERQGDASHYLDLEVIKEEMGFEIRYDGDPIILQGLYAIINKIAQHERILAK